MIAIQVLFYYHTGHCDNLEKAGVGTPFHNYKKKIYLLTLYTLCKYLVIMVKYEMESLRSFVRLT